MALVTERARQCVRRSSKRDAIQDIHSNSHVQIHTSGCPLDLRIDDGCVELTAHSYATVESVMVLCHQSTSISLRTKASEGVILEIIAVASVHE